MTSPRITLAAVAALLLGTGLALGQAQFIPIPNGQSAADITPDGTIVVGGGFSGAFYWRWQQDPTPTLIGGIRATGVSDDGTVITGDMIDPGTGLEVAGRWTEATGWVSLGYLSPCDGFLSNAHDISGDGSTIVGLAWAGCSARAFIWTEATGMVAMQVLAGGGNRASAISDDGSTIGGFAQGTFARTPAYWTPDGAGAVLDPDFLGEVAGFSNDGTYSVGTMYQGGSDGWYDAFVLTEDDGMTNLGSLSNGWAAKATDISEDAATICGYDYQGLALKAWIWTEANGIEDLQQKLISLGAGDVPSLATARAMSDDGNVVVGNGNNPFEEQAYIATLEAAVGSWGTLGPGLAGVQGVPSLSGAGTLVGGTTAGLSLTDGVPNGTAVLVLGFSLINAPLKGGVLYPSPTQTVVVPLDAAGSVAFQFLWPADLPSQASVYWQYWIVDPAGPFGYSASNGLESVTP